MKERNHSRNREKQTQKQEITLSVKSNPESPGKRVRCVVGASRLTEQTDPLCVCESAALSMRVLVSVLLSPPCCRPLPAVKHACAAIMELESRAGQPLLRAFYPPGGSSRLRSASSC
ncbi:hypothetical protein PBY51_009862 [Eleginops maclovinus]|uniref:Uncharacterized protein n=1 Tax=Eleginops maclovinus TaxID=56733 RepID=A0AAN8AVA8_ELEMC|nr:hypothetical protein PBY51_009862 [Eleginops maclovinus]